MGIAVERTTCCTSLAVSGELICPRSTADLPSETTSAATPACVGVPVEVEPSVLGTENRECGPYEVRLDREVYVLLVSTTTRSTGSRAGRAGAGGVVAGDGVARPDVCVEHAVGVVGELEVVAGEHHHRALVVRVVDGALDVLVQSQRCRRDVEHVDADVGGVHDRLGDAVRTVDGLVSRLDRHVPAQRAKPDVGEAVVALTDQLRQLAVEVRVDALLGLGIVVVAIEVPAVDVVGIAVVVVVEATTGGAARGSDDPVGDLAMAERDDEVLGRDVAVGSRADGGADVVEEWGGRGWHRRGLRLADVGRDDPRVVEVVLDVDHAVVVEVVAVARRLGLTAGVLWEGELGGVELGAVLQLAAGGDAPVDAALHVADGHVVAAPLRVLGAVPEVADAHPRGALRVGGEGRGAGGDAAVQVPGLGVPGVAGLTSLRGCVLRVVRVGTNQRGGAGGGVGNRGVHPEHGDSGHQHRQGGQQDACPSHALANLRAGAPGPASAAGHAVTSLVTHLNDGGPPSLAPPPTTGRARRSTTPPRRGRRAGRGGGR